MDLHRYWFKFNADIKDPATSRVVAGCGVTAFNYDDAISLMETVVFKGYSFPEIVEVIHDVDVSSLDPNHVRPNMQSPHVRGIWFPMGYAT